MPTKSSKKTKPAKPPARRQPETLRLRGLEASLTVNDLPRSIAFYRDVLGFVAGEEWRADGALMGIELHAGAITFYLAQDDFAKGRDRQKGVAMRFRCHTAQDLDRLAEQITARGGAVDEGPKDMPWGERVFMITDPDGFKLTFVQQR